VLSCCLLCDVSGDPSPVTLPRYPYDTVASRFRLGLMTALLLATALVASWVPARRAARTDPAVVLRAE